MIFGGVPFPVLLTCPPITALEIQEAGLLAVVKLFVQ